MLKSLTVLLVAALCGGEHSAATFVGWERPSHLARERSWSRGAKPCSSACASADIPPRGVDGRRYNLGCVLFRLADGGRIARVGLRLRGGNAFLGPVFSPDDSGSEDSGADVFVDRGGEGGDIVEPTPDAKCLLRLERQLMDVASTLKTQSAGRGDEIELSAESDTARAVSQIHLGDLAPGGGKECFTAEADAGGEELGGLLKNPLEEQLWDELTRQTAATQRSGTAQAGKERLSAAEGKSEMRGQVLPRDEEEEDILQKRFKDVEGVEILGREGGGLMMVGPASRFIFSKSLSASAVAASEAGESGYGHVNCPERDEVDGKHAKVADNGGGVATQYGVREGESACSVGMGYWGAVMSNDDERSNQSNQSGKSHVPCPCGGGSLCVQEWSRRDHIIGDDSRIHRLKASSLEGAAALGVRLASAGEEHVVIVCDDGRVMAAGSNEYGQLGIGHMCGGASSTEMRLGWAVRHPCHLTCDDYQHAQLVSVKIEPSVGKGVIKVVCSHHHTLMLLDNGQLLGWGRNVWGQLGMGRRKVVVAPQRLLVPATSWPRMRVVDVATGPMHTLVLLESGCVLGAGSNQEGQLGVPLSGPPASPWRDAEGSIVREEGGGELAGSCEAETEDQVWARLRRAAPHGVPEVRKRVPQSAAEWREYSASSDSGEDDYGCAGGREQRVHRRDPLGLLKRMLQVILSTLPLIPSISPSSCHGTMYPSPPTHLPLSPCPLSPSPLCD